VLIYLFIFECVGVATIWWWNKERCIYSALSVTYLPPCGVKVHALNRKSV